MSYCPECGTLLQAAEAEAVAEVVETAEVVSADVEIARINADRDVTLAKIGARVEEHVSDVDQAAELAAAEATAEALEEIVSPPEPEPSETPVVVVESEPTEEAPDSPVPAAEEISEPSESKPAGYVNPWFGG
jgi:hypothetical protein